jgi:hypothetical protein
MLVDGSKVVMVNVDEPGLKKYKVSGPHTMLDGLAKGMAQGGAGPPAGRGQAVGEAGAVGA